MPDSKQLKKVIWQYYGFQFFFSLLIWLPIFYEYQKRIGLSDQQIFSIQSIYYLAFCLMEFPTGMIADRLGPLKCLKAGAVILIISNLLPIFCQNYSGFLWHFLTIALSRSLISGASSAYIYEYLKGQSAHSFYKQVEGLARAYGLFGKVLFWACVGVLMQWHLTLPYWLTVVSAIISAFFAWTLPNMASYSQSSQRLGAQVVSALDLVKRSPFLLFVMFQGIAIFVLSRILQVNLFQPILVLKSFDLKTFGVVMSVMTVFEAVGSAKPNWIRKWLTDLNAVFLLTFVMGACLAFVSVSGPAATVGWICIFSYAAGLSFPIQRQLMNDTITDSRYRATLLSLESIFDRAVCAAVAPFIGFYLTENQLPQFLMISAYSTAFVMILLYMVMYFSAVPKKELERSGV